MEKVNVKVSMDSGSKEDVLKDVEELISAIEKANSLADELARKVGNLKLGFQIGRVQL